MGGLVFRELLSGAKQHESPRTRLGAAKVNELTLAGHAVIMLSGF